MSVPFVMCGTEQQSTNPQSDRDLASSPHLLQCGMTQRQPNGGLLRVALLANNAKTPLLVCTCICLPMFLEVGKLETTAMDLLAGARVKSQDHKAVGPSLTAALGEVSCPETDYR